MAARLFLSPAPQRGCKQECPSAEKEPPSKQRLLWEYGVVSERPASQRPASQCPSSSVEKRKYGVRGTCGTFAGKRPPKDEEKLLLFMQDLSVHKQKLQETPKGQKRHTTGAQQHYRDFVKAMLPQETEGTGKERLARVAALWKNRQTVQEKLAQENKSVL